MSASSRERISLVDSLRGMALLGIATIHSLAHFSCRTYPAEGEGWGAAWDQSAGLVTCLAFENKAYLLFSFLFGLSFFLQMDRAAHRGIDFRGKFAWRLALLFLFGLLNMIFFDGDILTIFALLGLLLIPLYKLPTKTVLTLSGLLLLNLPGLYDLAVKSCGYGEASVQHLFSSWKIAPRNDNSLADMAAWNYGDGLELRVLIQIVKGRIFETAGLFLLGMCAGRMRLFENIRAHASLWKKILLFGLPAAILLGLANKNLPGIAPPALRGAVGNLTMTYWPLAYTITFVAAISLLSLAPRFARLFETLFASAGRTSLTCYISQSVFFTFLYCGWGLGLASEMGLFLSSLAGVAFFFLQAAVSHLWLRSFKFGPLEWLWRSGTMLKWQPLLKKSK